MMGYEGRCVLLDDASEWVNIPFVVREFMKQLNDEAKSSRAEVETLRQEQKETNLLLRRVMQKQADLEIDSTRNLMSLGQQVSRAVNTSTEKRQAEQIHHLHKKTDKLEGNLQLLSSNIESLTQSALSATSAGASLCDLKGLVTSLTTKVETAEGLLKNCISAQALVQNPSESRLDAAALAAVTDAQNVLKGQLDVYSAQQRSSEKTMRRFQEATSSHREESARIRVKCEELTHVLEADRKTSQDRFTSCFHTVEKLEKLCNAQHAELVERVGRVEEACRGCESRSREEAKSLYSELRGRVIENQSEFNQRAYSMGEELRAVRDQQRSLAEQLSTASNETGVLSQHTMKQLKDISTRLAGLDAEVERFGSTLLERRDYQKEQRQMQDSLAEIRRLVAETVEGFQAQTQQLAASLKTMRAEKGEDNEWLHSELGRLSTLLGYTSQQREKQERQVTSLCEIVHNLSVAVETLQKERGSVAASSPAPTESPAHESSTVNNRTAEVSGAWEAWRSAFTEEVQAKIAAAVASSPLSLTPSPVLERVYQQLNDLSAKVDGGAKYTQAIVSQQMDQMRHTVRDEVANQLQLHPTLREVAPTLVEVEAVKRRVAGVELGLQTLSAHTDQIRMEVEDSDHSFADKVLQRVAVVEESVDDFQRRLLKLGDHMITLDHRGDQLARGAYEMEVLLQEQQRMSLKMGTDLTGALESLLHTETSLSRHESSTAKQLAEIYTWLEECKRGTQATLSMTAASVKPSVSAQDGLSSSATNTGDLCGGRGGLAAQLAGTVERLSAHIAQMEAGTLQAMRADLEALRGECAAATGCKIGDAALHTTTTLDANKDQAAHQELRRRLDVEESLRREGETSLYCLEKRLLVVEAFISKLSSLPKEASPLSDGEESNVTAAALERCADGLTQFHERLDAVKRQQPTKSPCCCSSDSVGMCEIKRHVHSQDVHDLQEELGQLQEKVHARVMSQLRIEMHEAESTLIETAASVAVLRCQDALRAATESTTGAVGEQTNTQRLSVLQAAVEEVQHTLQGRMSTLVEGCGRVEEIQETLRAALDDLGALRAAQSKLSSELEDVHSSNQARCEDLSLQLETLVSSTKCKVEELRAGLRASSLVSTTESREAGDCSQKPPDVATKTWVTEMMDSMQATYYTRTLLEERLENIWSSMISLLARKEDVSAVHDKLNGLHQLVQEETQIELQRLEEQLENRLEEKVSLANLQDILEHQISVSGDDSDDAVL